MKKILLLLSFISLTVFAVTENTGKFDNITTNKPSKTTIDLKKNVDIQSTGGLYLPLGTTGERPTPTKAGLLRFNSDSGATEVYNGSAWASVGVGTGITSLNGLLGSVQTLAVGSTGTDFNISSSGTTHTLNIPTASSANRGLLSTADWSTFNGKVPYTGATSNLELGTNFLGLGLTPTHVLDVQLPGDNNVFIDARTNPRSITRGVLRIEHTPSVTGTRAINVDLDMNGMADSHTLVADYKLTGLTPGGYANNIQVNYDTANSTGGYADAFDVAKTGTGAAEVTALHTGSDINVIRQTQGAVSTIEQAWTYNGAYTDTTTAFGSAATNVTLFNTNGDYVYIGQAATFSAIAVTLATPASTSVLPTFEYWNGAAWTLFVPGDGTNGFQVNGNIQWTISNLAGWATNAVNGVTKYYIRITRTKPSVTTKPIESIIKVQQGNVYSWDKNGAIVAASASLASGLTASSFNKVTITAPATSATLTIADGKTLTASNTLTLAGTDSTTMTFPTTSATIARTDAANTFTGNQQINGNIGIGTAALTDRAIYVAPTGMLTSSQHGMSVAPTFASSATSSIAVLDIGGGGSNTGTFTTSNVYGLYVYNFTKGTSQAITTKTGIRVDPLTTATNVRGLQITNASGANVYNLYIDGTAQNYLEGDLGVGTNSPSAKFDVHGRGSTTQATAQFSNSSGSPLMTILDSGSVGIGIASANTSSILDLTSTTKAFLPPRMTTTQRDAITASAAGMVIYDTTLNALTFNDGTSWVTQKKTYVANFTSAGVTTELNGDDWINGNCSLASSIFTCTINTGRYVNTPACTIQMNSTSGQADVRYASMNNTTLVYRTTDDAGTPADRAVQVICTGI